MAITTELVGSLGGTIPPVSFSYTESSINMGTYPIITIPAPVSGKYAFIVHIETTAATTTSAASMPRMIVTGSSANYYFPSSSGDVSRAYNADIVGAYGAMFPGYATGSITLNVVRNSVAANGSASCSGKVYFTKVP